MRVRGLSGPRTATIMYGPGQGVCRLKLILDDGRTFTAESSDYFECFMSVRRELEAEGMLVCCHGARRDVWASGMNRDMGAGLKAYLLTNGRAPRQDELTPIFAPADCATIGTVAEQERYASEWYASRLTARDERQADARE